MEESLERRLSREQLLKIAAAAGGATLLGGRLGTAEIAQAALAAESGRLQVLDWVGYKNDGGQAMFAAYVKAHPNNKPQFTTMTNESDALAKIHAGLKPDLFRPYVGWVKYFATSGLVEPWNPKLIPNFKYLNKFMVKAGQYNGKQYGIPDDWGFDAILYRSDKVHPRAKSWGLIFDDRYKNRIAWFDDHIMLVVAGLYLGIPRPWRQTDEQLKRSQDFLIKKKKLARLIWSGESDLWEAFGSGDVWIAYAWPNDWVQMKKLGSSYSAPKEKPVAGSDAGPEGLAAAPPRARVRERLELQALREVARGQLRLRACEHSGPAVVQRSPQSAAADEPEGGHGAGGAPRPRHSAPGGLRANVGAGEGLLAADGNRGSRRHLLAPQAATA
jgi:spermidine/putrescine-binding protein